MFFFVHVEYSTLVIYNQLTLKKDSVYGIIHKLSGRRNEVIILHPTI
jgi:hypothetical protein